MDRTAFTFDTIEKIKLAEKPNDVLAILGTSVEQFGFNKACAITSIPETHHNFPQYSYAERWPGGWHERYLDRGYLDVDPVIRKLRKSVHPFGWHEIAMDGESDRPGAVMMSEATEFGLLAGFNIPIHALNGQLATVMFAGDRFELSWDDRPALLLIAIFAHDKMRELLGVRPMHPDQASPLTPREIEVLKWAAEGKTSRDIADILSVSLPTVQSHMTNLCRKLDVVTRAQATARAIRWGILR